jgi:nucleoside-diphosphate-sugar epimerase
MKLLVTGSSGYIGRNITRYFLDRGIEIVGFDLIEFYSPLELTSGFEFIKGDINSPDDLARIQKHKNFDAVLHLAALKSVEDSFSYPDLYKKTKIYWFTVYL